MEAKRDILEYVQSGKLELPPLRFTPIAAFWGDNMRLPDFIGALKEMTDGQ
jgi:hypothetical protein